MLKKDMQNKILENSKGCIFNTDIHRNIILLKRILWFFITVFIIFHVFMLILNKCWIKHGFTVRIFNNIGWEGHSDKRVVMPNIYDLKDNFYGYTQNFSIEWDGYIYIDYPMEVSYHTESDDGSFLYIDDMMIIDNGGMHAPRIQEKTTVLDQGLHHILIKYFQGEGEYLFRLMWQRKGVDEVEVHIPWHLIYRKNYSLMAIRIDKMLIYVRELMYKVFGIVIFAIFIKLVIVLASYIVKKCMHDEEKGIYKKLAWVLIIGVCIRSLYIAIEYHWHDTYISYLAIRFLVNNHFNAGFFDMVDVSDWGYPPGWLLILYPFYSIWRFIFPLVNLIGGRPLPIDYSMCMVGHQYVYRILSKLPILIVEIVTAVVIFKVIAKRQNKTTGLNCCLLYFLNPAIIWVSAGTGVFDSFSIGLGILGLVLISIEQYSLSGLLMGLGVGIKMFPMWFVPAVLFVLFLKNPRAIFKYFFNLFLGIYLCFVYFVPHQLNKIAWWLKERYSNYVLVGDFTWWDLITEKICPEFFRTKIFPGSFFTIIVLAIIMLLVYVRFKRKSTYRGDSERLLYDLSAVGLITSMLFMEFVNWSNAIIIFPILLFVNVDVKYYIFLVYIYLVDIVLRFLPNFHIFTLNQYPIIGNVLLPILGTGFSIVLLVFLKEIFEKLFVKKEDCYIPVGLNLFLLPLIYANLLLFFTRQYYIDFFSKFLSVPGYFMSIIAVSIVILFIKYYIAPSRRSR